MRRVELRLAGQPTGAELTPPRAGTLLDALAWHVHRHPERVHIIFLDAAAHEAQKAPQEPREPREPQEHRLSYGALAEGARRIAVGLLHSGLRPRASVAIMLPTGLDYFETFFGVLLAGGVPVPIYPPARLSQIEDHFRRHAGILASAQAALMVTVPEAKALAHLLTVQVEGFKSVLTPAELRAAGTAGPHIALPPSRPDDLAFIQYTSGSTGNPKGVMLTHANLLASVHAMGVVARADSRDVFVSWLPLYHDMGLIGAWFTGLVIGFPLVVMSPLAFLARPERWLWAIHRYRGTLSGAPNFAYELCLRKIDDADIQGLDLSSWRYAFNGAEPVSARTIEAFTARFARHGLRRASLVPVYGLAEASLALTLPAPGRGLRIDRIRRDLFTRSARAEPADAAAGDGDVLRMVACGHVIPGHEMRVVDAAGRPLPERHEGQLQFKGPAATSGYLRRPDETAHLFDGAWLNTGDLAYIATGELYVTGRTKDLIIRGGRNLYPYELEDAVGRIAGMRRGCVAVFASPDPASGSERLIVLAETNAADAATRAQLTGAINGVAIDVLGMPPDDIVLAAPHTVLKTSSGKIRRLACRELYEGGMKNNAPRAVWWQVMRLAARGALPQWRRAWRAGVAGLWALYAWGMLLALAPWIWLPVVLLPRPAWSWAVGRFGARAFFALTGITLRVSGLEHLRDLPPAFVLVANHTSYLDGMVLVAALAKPVHFVAKRELAQQFFAGRLLRHLGAQFVERADAARGAEDAARLTEIARAGRPLAYFPEGTFTRAPGLRPFRLGAFVAAVQAGVPVLPLALRGVRAVLGDQSWMLRPGVIEVRIGAPMAPAGSDWAAAIGLRDAARAAVLRECGEVDLA